MAEKRMFTKKITDSDAFIEMSSAAQALYFHLNQSADDDGFNNQVQMAMFRSHASVDDLKVLMMKNFIIRFESGVIVIKHWRMHNTLRKDRYNPTNFQEELALLNVKDNGSYTLLDTDGCQLVAKRLPQYSIDKYSIDKISKDIVADVPSQRFQDDCFEMKCVDWLINICTSVMPNCKIPKTTAERDKWALEIDKMQRIDKYTTDQIIQVLAFLDIDDFWKSNIRSTSKLRKQFDTLYLQSQRRKPNVVKQDPVNKPTEPKNRFDVLPGDIKQQLINDGIIDHDSINLLDASDAQIDILKSYNLI